MQSSCLFCCYQLSCFNGSIWPTESCTGRLGKKHAAIKTGQWPHNLKSINYNWLQLVDLLEKLQLFVLRTNRRWWYPGWRLKPFAKSEKVVLTEWCTFTDLYVYKYKYIKSEYRKKCTCQNVKQIFSGRWLVMSQDSYPSGSPIFTMTPLPLN